MSKRQLYAIFGGMIFLLGLVIALSYRLAPVDTNTQDQISQAFEKVIPAVPVVTQPVEQAVPTKPRVGVDQVAVFSVKGISSDVDNALTSEVNEWINGNPSAKIINIGEVEAIERAGEVFLAIRVIYRW